MNNRLVVWFLVILVVIIWANMVRVSLPVILEFLRGENVEESKMEVLKFDQLSRNRDVGYGIVEPLRNPFERGIKKSRPVESVIRKENSEVYSLFNFRGTFSVDGKRIAILEGRSDLGVSGVFYVSEGDSIMNEKVVEIGENYVIILKDGIRLTLYEVR